MLPHSAWVYVDVQKTFGVLGLGALYLPQRYTRFDLAGNGDEPSGTRDCA